MARKEKGTRTVKVFEFKNLPTQAQGKNRSAMKRNDLTPGQQAQAAGKDIVAIRDSDDALIILAPTEDLGDAISIILEEENG